MAPKHFRTHCPSATREGEKTAGAGFVPLLPALLFLRDLQHHPAECGVSRVLILHLLLAHLIAPFPALHQKKVFLCASKTFLLGLGAAPLPAALAGVSWLKCSHRRGPASSRAREGAREGMFCPVPGAAGGAGWERPLWAWRVPERVQHPSTNSSGSLRACGGRTARPCSSSCCRNFVFGLCAVG